MARQESSGACDVSVIVVNWNLREMLRECLLSVRGGAGGLDVETLVVDNASEDGSAGMVARGFPEMQLIGNSVNLGFARANNQALPSCSGRYLLLLNNDAVLLDGALERLVGFMDTHPAAGVCGPRIENPDGTPQARTGGRFPSITTALGHFFLPAAWQQRAGRPLGFYRPADAPGGPADWVSGAAMLVRREAAASVGPLDDKGFMYCEDVDWCLRMWRVGWSVHYVPEARVRHHRGLSMKKQTGWKVGAHQEGLIAFYAKYHGGAASAAFRAVLWVGYGLRATGWMLAALAGRREGVGKLKRLLGGGKVRQGS
ncbi:MAG: glycosyltransferase family 2 protein [Thermoleophilia bacterium]